MRLLKHEMRQGILSLAIWTGSIAFLMVICIVMFPEMKGQMEDVSDMFASMGSFTAAFGMDRLSFGTLTGTNNPPSSASPFRIASEAVTVCSAFLVLLYNRFIL